jgi:hypothetical protein
MWKKSTYSAGYAGCVEVAFRKSSHSMANGDCVEVAPGAAVLVRDSKDPEGPRLEFTRSEWRKFLTTFGQGCGPPDIPKRSG